MNRLKELRTKNRLNQTELATTFSVKQNTISNWENGSTEIDNQTLAKLADYFNVSVDYLLGREEKKEPPAEARSREEFSQALEKLGIKGNDTELAKMLNKISNLSDSQKKLILQTIDNFKHEDN